VVGALGASGLPASRLELEITETVLLQDDGPCSMSCIRCASSACESPWMIRNRLFLAQLFAQLPFDKIKIDRSFIRELGKENDCVAIIRAVTRLGHSLGMITTAEGVETKEQLDILRTEGCTQVQASCTAGQSRLRKSRHCCRSCGRKFAPPERTIHLNLIEKRVLAPARPLAHFAPD